MKSYLTLFLSVILFTSCISDDETTCTPQTDEDIVEYIESKDLITTKTESGLYYTVNNEGTGETPTENSIVDVKYKTYFLDGTGNAESESIALNLSTLIPGLSEGIQLFKEGGSGTLIIPSELAFGESGNSTGSIPCGTVLVFEIEVLAVHDSYEAQNEVAILKYIDDNDLDAIKTESGLYYVINTEGTGAQPTSTSNVTVSYKGTFLNGETFDESTVSGIDFNLSQVIAGWTEGITYFKEGGEGILLVPYTLGYGQYGSGAIPGYTPLAFDVKLISVNN
ncbi:FKBP-type peptidyl-prolyl cis-trans isomerase [Polaribacter sp. HaHaR_3_91]|uniref:FKBP-type peptidyl-prolyl cis-trans isomerase n=1 Tax=Polaribacter sp. HaHaR_3_91 TaxID=2745561 RepID=UPI0034A267F9